MLLFGRKDGTLCRLLKLTTITLVFVALIVSVTRADVPTKMNVQGRLTDSTGAPIGSATPQIDFSIWDAPAGGTQLWPVSGTEPHAITTDVAGLWDARIGTTIPLTPDVFADSSRWLQIIVDAGAGPTLLPRIEFDTSPFAFRASTSRFADSATAIAGSEPGPYLPLTGGTMTGDVSSIGEPSITMGKGNFGPANDNSGPQAFVAGSLNRALVTTQWSAVDNTTMRAAHIPRSPEVEAASLIPILRRARTRRSVVVTATLLRATAHPSAVASRIMPRTSRQRSAAASTTRPPVIDLRLVVVPSISPPARHRQLERVGNQATGDRARVGGGDGNMAYGDVSTISGGERDTVFGLHATIGGGELNTASGAHSTIGGGIHNRARADFSTIGGGSGNTTSGLYSVVTGGGDDWGFYPNVASGNWSTVAGGRGNLPRATIVLRRTQCTCCACGSSVWADTTFNTFTDDRANEFAISAENGLRVESHNTAVYGRHAPERQYRMGCIHLKRIERLAQSRYLCRQLRHGSSAIRCRR